MPNLVVPTRRLFLGGVLSLTGAALLPRIPSYVPTIFADGVHDDAPGLNALLRRQPVEILMDVAVKAIGPHEYVWLNQANLLMRSTIIVDDDTVPLCMSDCRINNFADNAAIWIKGDCPRYAATRLSIGNQGRGSAIVNSNFRDFYDT